MGILVKVVHSPVFQQSRFIQLSLTDIPLHGTVQTHPAAHQGNILGNQLPYPLFQLRYGEIRSILHLDIDTPPQSAADLGHRFRPKLPDSQKNDKLGRTGIDLPTRFIGIAEQAHFAPGCGHGPADGDTLLGILLPDGHIVQCEHLAGDLRRQRAAGKGLAVQTQFPDQFQK